MSRFRCHPLACWLATGLALVAIRMWGVPWADTDVLTVHRRAVESLLAGQNWGRQALFASLEYPPLTMLGALIGEWLGKLLRIDGGRLTVAVAQVWALLYAVRTPRGQRARLLGTLALAATFSLPFCAGVLVRADPNWVLAVPAACVLFHLSRWELDTSLRDLVVLSISLGLLVFGGVVGLALSVSLLVAALFEVATHPSLPTDNRHGAAWLLTSPPVYCAALVLLFNWLIMGDPLVPFRQASSGIIASPTGGYTFPHWALLVGLALFALNPAALVARRRFGLHSALLLTLLAVLAVQTLAANANLFPAGARCVLALAVAISAATALVARSGTTPRPDAPSANTHTTPPPPHPTQRQWRMAMACVTLALTLGAFTSTPAHSQFDTALHPAPTPSAVGQTVDRTWAAGRVIICGVRTPAAFPDLTAERFLPSVDFQYNALLKRAETEQIHLLLPPPDWRQPTGPMSPDNIRHEGATRFLLEAVWPGGWQLWRYVIPPKE